MKKVIFSIAFLMTLVLNTSVAQNMAKHSMAKGDTDKKVQTIKLAQVTGDFGIQGFTLSEGDYVFEIANNGVDHEVGFVIAPAGKTDQKNHIPEAYVQKTIKDGEVSQSKVVSLKKGEYVYFCPMNPTPQYTITVK